MTADIEDRKEKYPTIKDMGGRILDLRRFVHEDDKDWSATNASIGMDNKGRYCVAIRSSNYVITDSGKYLAVTTSGLIRSKVWFSELDKDFKCKDLRQIDLSGIDVDLERGLEDPKLFWRDKHWQFTAVMLERHTPRARMVICHLDKKATKVTDMEILPGIDARRPEKNWAIPYDINPHFEFLYSPTATIKDGYVSSVLSDSVEISGLRGNTNLLLLSDGTYLSVVHRMWGDHSKSFNPRTFSYTEGYIREYVHYFAQYTNKGRLICLSEGFHFFIKGIEFAAGLSETRDEFLISYGSRDISSHIAFLSKDIVLKSLTPVVY